MVKQISALVKPKQGYIFVTQIPKVKLVSSRCKYPSSAQAYSTSAALSDGFTALPPPDKSDLWGRSSYAGLFSLMV